MKIWRWITIKAETETTEHHDDCTDCDGIGLCKKASLTPVNTNKLWCIKHRAAYYSECKFHVQEEIRDYLSVIQDRLGDLLLPKPTETPPAHILLAETPLNG